MSLNVPSIKTQDENATTNSSARKKLEVVSEHLHDVDVDVDVDVDYISQQPKTNDSKQESEDNAIDSSFMDKLLKESSQSQSRPTQKKQTSTAPAHHTRDPTDFSLLSAMTDLDGYNDSLTLPRGGVPSNNPGPGQNLKTIEQSGLELTELDTAVASSSTIDKSLIIPNDNMFHVSSGIHIDSLDEVTMKDILRSTREGEDETDIIRRIDNVPSHQYVSKESLFPNITDNFLDNIEHNEEHIHYGDGGDDDDNVDSNVDQKTETAGDAGAPRTTSRRSTMNSDTSNNLSDLTRRLVQLPSYRKHHTTSQRTRPNINDSQSNGAPNTKTGADLYYQNAAKIFPTRRRTSNTNSDESSRDDIETGSDEISKDRGEEYDPSKKKTKKNRSKFVRNFRSFGMRRKADLDMFKEFVEPHRKSLRMKFFMVVSYVMLPSLIISFTLFYGFDNPPTGLALGPCPNLTEAVEELTDIVYDDFNYPQVPMQMKQVSLSPTVAPTVAISSSHSPSSIPTIAQPSVSLSPTTSPTKKPTYAFSDTKNTTICRNQEKSLEEASVSWWFIFVGVRQVLTFCLSVLLELIIIDFLTFRTRFFPKLLGTKLALAVGQSKGWPFLLFFWAVSDMIFLYGPRKFAHHWLYYQNTFAMANSTNPSGNITDSKYYRRIIYLSLGLSVAATIKRTVMANFVGQRVVAYYRRDLSKIIKKLLVVSDVAELSNVAKRHAQDRRSIFQRLSSVGRMVADRLESDYDIEDDDEDTQMNNNEYPPIKKKSVVTNSAFMKSSMNGSNTFLTSIYENLDEWEEPELQDVYQAVSTTDVLHFRRAVDFINSDYPFSPAFGKATTREECAQTSQNIFDKLLVGRRKVLDFKDICKSAESPDGTNDKKKVLELVRLFRPNRAGEITKLEFVKSIDSVYKQLRLILANINSSSQIDRAYGQITNLIFFGAAVLLGLFCVGVNIENLVLGAAGLLVSFAFMIGAAASKYLEGILLILVRRPYDIGDRVCFLEANAGTDDNGPPSGGWIVESVDLYTTTVRLGTTREYATFTNGSLSNSRILNLKRSEKPNVYMYLKFTMNVTQEQLDEYRSRIIGFIKDRPREWIKVVGFRCTHVETELQYLKYALIVQHRESWQSFATIQISKGDVFIFALLLQKELSMEYTAPKMPVQLSGDPASSLTKSFVDQNTVSKASQYLFGTPPLNDANNDRTFRNPLDDPPLDDTKVNHLTGVQSTQFSTGTAGVASNWLSESQNTTQSEISRLSFEDEKPSDETKSKFV